MILTIKVHRCPKCGSVNIVRNGHDYKGSQKYYCNDCKSWGTLDARPRYSAAEKTRIVLTYLERASMRGIERIFGVARRTLARWIEQIVAQLPDLAKTLAAARSGDVLELDELWSFVLKKDNKKWVWIALCRRTRQIVAFFVGDRSEKSCREVWKRIPDTYKHCCTYSDFWKAYAKVFATGKHQSVGKETGQTAHVERWNNTLRQRLARFVRKTLSFSKSEKFHRLTLRLFIHHYNLQRIS
jgi:insertion element IS1 protein InsB